MMRIINNYSTHRIVPEYFAGKFRQYVQNIIDACVADFFNMIPEPSSKLKYMTHQFHTSIL